MSKLEKMIILFLAEDSARVLGSSVAGSVTTRAQGNTLSESKPLVASFPPCLGPVNDTRPTSARACL